MTGFINGLHHFKRRLGLWGSHLRGSHVFPVIVEPFRYIGRLDRANLNDATENLNIQSSQQLAGDSPHPDSGCGLPGAGPF
ncbi:hypothetical protein PICSAR21_04574 [Mycobacterium avium subsp. paratuberculosis]|nr:hypothetical protein PICSAR21_04574 [Mycobacterium avium subsp. paratuberculosis]CAG7212052.1 hypothetical protein PICSAR253_04564 [Mycobacterium avium subsp. paratuberculosis]